MRLHLVFSSLIVLFLASCTGNKNSFKVSGNISGMPEQTVYLSELGIDKITIVDSAKSDKGGSFVLNGKALEAGLYRIGFSSSADKYILLSIDKGDITVSGDWNALYAATITGSSSAESLQAFLKNVRNQVQTFNTMGMILDTFKARGDDSMIQVVQQDMKAENFKFTHFIEEYADSTSSLPNALFAVQMLNPQAEKEYFGQFMNGLSKRFPQAQLTKDFTAKMNKLYAMADNNSPSNEIGVGLPAPEIALYSPEGKEIKLTSLKGKYVLVDFWASWCGPCRKENPNVVAAFNKFKDKNFTILGVSLDDDKEKWVKAIQDDKLTWAHVSDLKGWQSVAARIYEIQSIPANFLVDPQGFIIASNLRGDELEDKLKEVLK